LPRTTIAEENERHPSLTKKKGGRRKLKAAASGRLTADASQVAALPVKMGDYGITQVLLVTSRETQCWRLSKRGHPLFLAE
jgi:hypothetical protein